MRLIAVLIVLLILGLLVSRQLSSGPSIQAEYLQRNLPSNPDLPKAPVTAAEAGQFSQQMGDYVKAEAQKRDAAIEAETK